MNLIKRSDYILVPAVHPLLSSHGRVLYHLDNAQDGI